jgi:hypothetical protein
METESEVYSSRSAFAERFFTADLKKQREWYSEKAVHLKKRGEGLSFLVILFGALTALIQAFPETFLHDWRNLASAMLGSLVVVVEGWKKIARYDETWKAYRIASERMKHERRLYLNVAGAYKISDEEAAQRLFVEAIENVISEEQQIFWASHSDEAKAPVGTNGKP